MTLACTGCNLFTPAPGIFCNDNDSSNRGCLKVDFDSGIVETIDGPLWRWKFEKTNGSCDYFLKLENQDLCAKIVNTSTVSVQWFPHDNCTPGMFSICRYAVQKWKRK